MNKWLLLTLCIAGPLLTGAVAGYMTTANLSPWYSSLTKPSFNPPNYLFGPVWTTIYILMGLSFYYILQAPPQQGKTLAIRIYLWQWGLNFLWSFLFFHYKNLGLALAEIVLLWISIFAMIVVFSKIDKRAAWLNILYISWVSFATILNASIFYLNRPN